VDTVAVMRRAFPLLAIALLLPLLVSACGEEVAPTGELEDKSAQDALGGAPGEEESAGLAPSAPQAGEIAGQSGAGGSPQVAGASIDRKIIQTASVSLQVKAVGEAFQEVGRIASGAGGFVSNSSFSNVDDEQVASVTIRVPAVRFQDVLGQLRGLAVKVENEQSQASDVTEEYSDLGARLRNLEATEAQYLEFLKRAKDIGEVLQVQDRLNGVRAEIEQVRGRMNLLENLSDLSTITVHLRPESAPAAEEGGRPDPAEAAGKAWDASLDTLWGIATVVVAIAAFAWWLVPLLVLLAVAGRMLSPRREGRNKQ